MTGLAEARLPEDLASADVERLEVAVLAQALVAAVSTVSASAAVLSYR